MFWNLKDKNDIVLLLLEVGIAFSLFYAAIFSFLEPSNWIWFFPEFIRNIFPGNTILHIFSVVEILVGLWLLSNYKVEYPAIITALMMTGIIIFNYELHGIIFRDVPILFAAVALAVLSISRKNIKIKKIKKIR